MPIDQNVIASGLSLTRESGPGASASQLLPVVEECRQGLLDRQKEPYISKLQEIAEQSQDPEAACLACVLLGAYYDNSFRSCPNGDPDRVLYYAETVKGLGEAYRARYHYILCCHFLHMYNINGCTESDLGKAMEHAAEALKHDNMDIARILATDDNIKVLCDVIMDDTERKAHGYYWGTAYLACRVRMKDPSLSPLEREELGFKATAILREVTEIVPKTVNSNFAESRYYLTARTPFPAELQIARTAAADRPEDAKLIDEIIKLCRRTRFKVTAGPTPVERFFSSFLGPLVSLGLASFSVATSLPIILEGSSSDSNFLPLILSVFGVALAVVLPDILCHLEQGHFGVLLLPRRYLSRQAGIHATIALAGLVFAIIGASATGSFEEGLPVFGLPVAVFFPPISVWLRYHFL